MFGIGKKRSDRRRKVRRERAESSKSAWERFQARVGLWPTLVTAGFFLVTTAIALSGDSTLRYRVGWTIDRPVYARVHFSRVDEEQTRRAREGAKAATPSTYRINDDLIARIGGELQELYQTAKGAESFDTFVPVAAEHDWTVSPDAFAELRRLSDEAGGHRYARCLDGLKRRLRGEYTIRPTAEEDRQPASNSTVARVLPGTAPADGGEGDGEAGAPLDVPIVQLIPISNPRFIEGQGETLAGKTFPSALRSTVAAVLTRHLSSEPMLIYDQAETRAATARAFDSVEDVIIHYGKGDQLLAPPVGEARLTLKQEHIDLLHLEHEAYRRVLDDPADSEEGPRLRKRRTLARVGSATLLALLTFALFAYVRQYQPRILEVRSRTLAFVSLLLALLVSSKLLSTRIEYLEPTSGPMLMVAAILIIAYNPRFASGVCAIASLMVVLTIGGDIAMLVLLCTGAAVVTLTLVEIRTRTQMVVSGMLTAATVAVVCFAFALIQGQQTELMLRRAGLAAGTAIVAALIVHAALPFIERAFKIATSLTLQEWGDATKPLLQRLAHDAPGTYNHSLVLGTMAGTACEAIGANGLLARVGALYHDVGKILKHDYFVENQEASINRHDSLSPTMSLLIIVGHVKDGIEMAKEYGLPRVLHQFIEEHHGTTVVRYFHHAASEKQPQIASGKHDRTVPDTEFRYPGPKPRGKESAILMFCDGVEGAVRALAEPTPGRIESIVHSVLVDRLNDGQFDDCEITLRELHRVEQSLVKSLCRFYHGRVAYPSGTTRPEKVEDEQTARSAG